MTMSTNVLCVYADFDWLDRPALVGHLLYDRIRGGECYGFEFDRDWLRYHGDIFFGDDLHSFAGRQYTAPGKDIFGCFSDALPDRWGRMLLMRREQIEARDQLRPVRRLTSFDYLCGIDDYSRMGGFRFSKDPGGDFINTGTEFKVPPLTGVGELMHAAHEVERSELDNELPSRKWIAQLVHPGTSLGGARPKASVVDEDGHLAVAKFPSRKDDYDVGLWEHFAHVMARKAGINAADTRTLRGGNYRILLSRRFDRTETGRRIHFASAMTLLGVSDGDNAANGFGYIDIVDFILRHGINVEHNLEELFRRVAFNILIGNSDDHFRNHGFLLSRRGWELAPAYDLNPTLANHQCLLINRGTDEADPNILLASSDDYILSREKAGAILSEVKRALAGWDNEARRLGLPQRDIDMFAPRINKWL